MMDAVLRFLRELASDRGIIMVREPIVLKSLKISAPQLAETLVQLEGKGEIEVQVPGRYLVIRIKRWSGERGMLPIPGQSPYSYPMLLQSQRLNNSYRLEPGMAGDKLLQEILETLGETDAGAFKKAVELYSPYVIRTALGRVRQTRDIRKNRTALFRHLLPRLAKKAI